MANKYRQFPTTGGEDPNAGLRVVRKPRLPQRAVPKGTATRSAATTAAVRKAISSQKSTFHEKGKNIKKTIESRKSALKRVMEEM